MNHLKRKTLLNLPLCTQFVQRGTLINGKYSTKNRDLPFQYVQKDTYSSQINLFDRKDATKLLLKAKRDHGKKYEDLANKVGRDKVWLAAVIHGQMTMSKEEAYTLCTELGLSGNKDLLNVLQQVPTRGQDMTNMPPTDPTMYRLYEMVVVYGPTFKDLIHEEFGDGIMSAIDLKVDFKREQDPKGDRVHITLSGKCLPYSKW